MDNIVLMRSDTDCEIAAVATACGVSYDEARSALNWHELGGLENPLFGNPLNLYRAIVKLGYWKRNVTLTDLLDGRAEAGRTIVLIHNLQSPNLSQHWIVWQGIQNGFHLLSWGSGKEFKRVTSDQLSDYYRKGWPNCAFQVYRANVFRILWERIKLLFSKEN
ncbi:hypothetical protein EOM82_08855 [bacterium]|nr:hypothetical protein [bacterium]